LICGAAVVVLWAGYFFDGTASLSLLEPTHEVVLSLGRLAGISIAALLLVAAVVSAQRRSHTPFALGALAYASLNTMGESLAASASSGPLLLVTFVAACAAAVALHGPAHGLGRLARGALLLLCMVAASLALVFAGLAGPAPAVSREIRALPWPHYLAELGMASSTALGWLARFRDRPWGTTLALFGMGAYLYSTLAAMDWALLNDPKVLPMLVLTCVVSLLGLAHVARTSGE
jgi:hypothetical protein